MQTTYTTKRDVTLHYSASPLARSLVLGKTNTVAIVVPDLENPTFHGVLRGLSRAAARDGYHVLIADSAESVTEERVLAVETRRRCDGLILCAPRMAEKDLLPLLDELKPVVVVNRDPGLPSTPVVAADYQTALTDLLDLLYNYGHHSLVCLAGAPQSASNTRRLAALRAFLDGHSDVEIEVLPCGVSFAQGYESAGPRARVVGDRGARVQRPRSDGPNEGPERARHHGARGDVGRGLRRHPIRPLPNPTTNHRVSSGHRARPARLATEGEADQDGPRPRAGALEPRLQEWGADPASAPIGSAAAAHVPRTRRREYCGS